jgi:hypothetical protein
MFSDLLLHRSKYELFANTRTQTVLDMSLFDATETENLFNELSRFLAYHRSSYRRAYLNQEDISYRVYPLDLTHSLGESITDDYVERSTILDTALIKSYFKTSGRLVGPLLRVENYCDLEETEKLLLEHKVCI